jgi:hypothetical protein
VRVDLRGGVGGGGGVLPFEVGGVPAVDPGPRREPCWVFAPPGAVLVMSSLIRSPRYRLGEVTPPSKLLKLSQKLPGAAH